MPTPRSFVTILSDNSLTTCKCLWRRFWFYETGGAFKGIPGGRVDPAIRPAEGWNCTRTALYITPEKRSNFYISNWSEILCKLVYLPYSSEWLILAGTRAITDLYSQTDTRLQSMVQVVPSCGARLHLPTSLLRTFCISCIKSGLISRYVLSTIL
jgi:hypothetical protein